MLFNEIYGNYYNAVAEILKYAVRGELTQQNIYEITDSKAFAESVLSIPGALNSGEWPFLTEDLDTPLIHEPQMPLTTPTMTYAGARLKRFSPVEYSSTPNGRSNSCAYLGVFFVSFFSSVISLFPNDRLKSTYIACGVHLKFTPPRINNYRPYLTAGLTPMYDLTVKDQENIQVKPFNLMLELGLGLERYLPYFKFIPEIKFCFGLLDILEKDRSSLRDESKKIFTQSVDKGKTNMVVLSFYFE